MLMLLSPVNIYIACFFCKICNLYLLLIGDKYTSIKVFKLLFIKPFY